MKFQSRHSVVVTLLTCLLCIFMEGCSRKSKPATVTQAASTGASPEFVQANDIVLDSALTVVDLQATDRPRNFVDQLASKRESIADTWDSEVVGQKLDKQLKTIAKWISSNSQNDDGIQRVVSPNFRTQGLLPVDLDVAYQHENVTVERSTEYRKVEVKGVDGFQKALNTLKASLANNVDRNANSTRAKFKLFRIEPASEGIRSRIYYEVSTHGETSLQQSATWDATWTAEKTPRLLSVAVSKFEQAKHTGPAHLFADVTASVLSRNPSYQNQVLPGIPYWIDRMSREFMSQFGHHGLAVGDINGDGLDDLYVCDTGGLPNRLYLHQPDGTALDVSATSGVDLLEDSVGCLLVDLDNDGDQDLVVATDPLLQFAENDGTGKFEIRRGFYANTDSYSLTAADYDNDGDVDIYLCGYNARKQDPVNRGLPFPVPYQDANNGGRNHLLRNAGDFVFDDVTQQVGLDQHNTRFSLAASWEDFDNDGDMDLYVANDFGRNNLFRNDNGMFTDIAADTGVEDQASGMSVSWSDFNRDGFMDVYISNMFSAAGNRVTFQRKFAEGLEESAVEDVQRMARGNTLFSANPQGTFSDVSEQFAVTLGRWAWSSRFADLNNDGWEDLLVANGYVTNEETSDL